MQTNTALATVRRYDALVRRIEGRDWLDTQPGERVAIHVRSEDVGGAYSLIELAAAPNFGVAPHTHGKEDELFFITDGWVRFQCNERAFVAPAGTSVVVPRGVVHSWQNLSADPARMLIVFTPGGIEHLFEEIAGRSRAEIEQIARRYGTAFADIKVVASARA